MEATPVKFINSMTRARRKIQMTDRYPAKPKIKADRHRYSKYRADEYKASKKDIQKIALLKTNIS